MPKPVSLDALIVNLATLALVAPDELSALEILVEAAVKRHQDTTQRNESDSPRPPAKPVK